MKPGCNCELCREAEEIRVAVETRDVDALIGLVERLAIHAADAETENERYVGILAGEWPGAMEILRDAMEKASAVAEREALATVR